VLTAVVGLALVALVIAVVIVVAREPGPPPSEVALAYELAWDRLDFETLWALSGHELHDGLPKHEFIAAKQAAYRGRPELRGIAADVVIEQVAASDTTAVARTRVASQDGATVRNEVRMDHRDGRWVVIAYELRPDSQPRPTA
jgi:hypothetical protein